MKKNPIIRVSPASARILFTIPIVMILLFTGHKSMAQPFLDIVNLKYSNSPGPGRNNTAVKLQYLGLSTNLPLQFKNKKDAVIFSPYFEKWWSQIIYNPKQGHYGIGLPVSLIKSIPNTRWAVLINAIVRINDSVINKKSRVQVGGAFVVTYKKNDNLTLKLGVYVNNELFGVFVMPLAGIDWKINERNNLFGILPGNLTYEHTINEHFYYGACFRAITNSYGNGNGFWRIDENQLGLYLDTYLNKNFVFNAEAGQSLFRKIRTGMKDIAEYDTRANDGFYFKLGLVYRVRFAKR